MELIDKAAVVAELEKLYNLEYDNESNLSCGKKIMLRHILFFLDTLKVKEVDEQKERMSKCPYRQVGCKMYEDKILECNGACSWVVDYPRLKELKAQKGE